MLRTNTDFPADQVALKYKELWRVEQVFRDMKSVLDTRPIFHQRDETIRGHVFCSFLALVLMKELYRRLEKAGHDFEWADIKQDLSALQEITLSDNGKKLAVRSACKGVCGKVFQAVGVAMPLTIREAPMTLARLQEHPHGAKNFLSAVILLKWLKYFLATVKDQ